MKKSKKYNLMLTKKSSKSRNDSTQLWRLW